MKNLSIQVNINNEKFNELIFSNNSLKQDMNYREICFTIIKKLFENINTITYCTNYKKQMVKSRLFCKNEEFVNFDDNKAYAKHQKIHKNTLVTYTTGFNETLITDIFKDNYPLQIPFSMYGYKKQLTFEKIENVENTDYFLYCSYEECHDKLTIFCDSNNFDNVLQLIQNFCDYYNKSFEIYEID